MIPFDHHPLVRAGLTAFFTIGFAYGSAVAALERRWSDEIILVPVLLLCLFGMAKSWTAVQRWRRSIAARVPEK